MAAGEKKWSSKGQAVTKYVNVPLPAQDWDCKILGETVEVRKRQEPGTFPYINVALEALDSAVEEGGRNRRIYHMFFLKLTPGSDGVSAPNRNGGITEFARALGEDTPDFDIVTMKDEDGQSHEVLNPKQVMAWVKSKDGVIVRLASKIQRQKDRDPQSRVDQFHASGDEAGPDQGIEEEEGLENGETEEAEIEETYETSAEEETEESEDEEVTPPARGTARNGVKKPVHRAPPPTAKGKARPHARR